MFHWPPNRSIGSPYSSTWQWSVGQTKNMTLGMTDRCFYQQCTGDRWWISYQIDSCSVTHADRSLWSGFSQYFTASYRDLCSSCSAAGARCEDTTSSWDSTATHTYTHTCIKQPNRINIGTWIWCCSVDRLANLSANRSINHWTGRLLLLAYYYHYCCY